MNTKTLSEVLRIGNAVGLAEGWSVFRRQNGDYEVCRLDEAGILATDSDAVPLARAAGINCRGDGIVVGLFDPCHAPVVRGVEHWNTLALESQIHVLDQLIAADMAAGCEHSGWHVDDRDDHTLEAILDYLRETLEKCGGAT
jgi:hypothetical protein